MPLGREVGLSPSDIVLDGVPAPLLKEGQSQFSALVYCGQTAGWIQMELRKEVGLGPGHIVLDGDPPPPPKKKGNSLHFRPISIVAKRLYGSRWHLARR